VAPLRGALGRHQPAGELERSLALRLRPLGEQVEVAAAGGRAAAQLRRQPRDAEVEAAPT
jgi:hypothetical protein